MKTNLISNVKFERLEERTKLNYFAKRRKRNVQKLTSCLKTSEVVFLVMCDPSMNEL